jgi:putative two-component system response regulator
VLERTRELESSHEETIRRLARALEFRDEATGLHVERMSRCCALLARRLGLPEQRCEVLRVARALHDVGKIASAESILLKPGPLSPKEWTIMWRHTEIGHAILAGSGSELLELAATIALTHHERADGGGYPRGLAGEEIPLEGRIAAVADVSDALTSDRPYRSRYAVADAVAILSDGRGTGFDPRILDAFFALRHELGALGYSLDDSDQRAAA